MHKLTRFLNRFSYSWIIIKRLVITDFKLRYQGSVMGYFWSLLKPFSIFAVLYVVFVNFLKIGSDIENYPIYLLLGIILWTFFNEVTTGNVSSIVGKGNLIKKINFPKYVIVISSSISALINLFLNLLVVLLFIVVNGVDVSWGYLWLVPLVAQLYLISLGLGFFLSAMYVKYKDIGYVWDAVLQAGFYGTPILYPLSVDLIGLRVQKLLLLNPVAQIIQDARFAVVTTDTRTFSDVYEQPVYRLIPVLLTVSIFIFGALFFRSKSSTFAEES